MRGEIYKGGKMRKCHFCGKMKNENSFLIPSGLCKKCRKHFKERVKNKILKRDKGIIK